MLKVSSVDKYRKISFDVPLSLIVYSEPIKGYKIIS